MDEIEEIIKNLKDEIESLKNNQKEASIIELNNKIDNLQKDFFEKLQTIDNRIDESKSNEITKKEIEQPIEEDIELFNENGDLKYE